MVSLTAKFQSTFSASIYIRYCSIC